MVGPRELCLGFESPHHQRGQGQSPGSRARASESSPPVLCRPNKQTGNSEKQRRMLSTWSHWEKEQIEHPSRNILPQIHPLDAVMSGRERGECNFVQFCAVVARVWSCLWRNKERGQWAVIIKQSWSWCGPTHHHYLDASPLRKVSWQGSELSEISR